MVLLLNVALLLVEVVILVFEVVLLLNVVMLGGRGGGGGGGGITECDPGDSDGGGPPCIRSCAATECGPGWGGCNVIRDGDSRSGFGILGGECGGVGGEFSCW